MGAPVLIALGFGGPVTGWCHRGVGSGSLCRCRVGGVSFCRARGGRWLEGMTLSSPCGSGDLFRPGASHAEQFADLSPGPSLVQDTGEGRLHLLHVGFEPVFDGLDAPVPLDEVVDAFEGADQRVVCGVRGLGHGPRVGRFRAFDKQCLTGRVDRLSVFLGEPSTAWNAFVVHSHRTQSADDAQTKSGPDNTTLTSCAGPDHQVL